MSGEKKEAVVAYAIERIREGIRICEKAGVNAKAINFLLIGLAGVKKDLRREK